MWVRLGMVLGVISHIFAQTTHTRIQHGGASFEWGWQFTPDVGTSGAQYYVNLPEVTQQAYQELTPNTTQVTQETNIPFVDIYMLNQQLTPTIEQQPQLFQYIPNNVQGDILQHNTAPNYYYSQQTPRQESYNVNTHYTIDHNQNAHRVTNENVNSQPLQKKEAKEEHEILTTNVVQVFKDHNCTDDSSDNGLEDVSQHYINNIQKSNLVADSPSYEVRNVNGNFGVRQTTERPLTYKGAATFNIEPQRENARSERYYYSTAASPRKNSLEENNDNGITKLVASTQDLISNEDLLRINHAAEKQYNAYNDDIIKPKSKFGLRAEQTRYGPTSHANSDNKITVKAKIENIVDSEIEHIENNQSNEQILQTDSNDYKFASPIVVEDSTYNDFKEQIVSNLVSTMVPYLTSGYEITNVRESFVDNYTNNFNEGMVNVTPRPIGQKYLAPITVALRLLNSNNSDVLNSVEDDHEASDSELVEDTVKIPQKETTTVEVQQSIPVDITHINDVEVHEYLEEGRANNRGPFDTVKNLYNKYVAALESSRKIQTNMNQNHYKYGMMKNFDNSNFAEKSEDYNEGREKLESSENVQAAVEVKPNGESVSNERKEFVRDYYDYNTENQKIIQPIIIEKQVPVTKFVDRFIEKQVPYPEPVEIFKAFPVDRPVPVPVPYEKVVEKPVEVTKFIDKPYPIEVPHPYPVEVKVPYPIEQKVFVDRPIHVPYPIEKLVEKQIVQPIPVPTPIAIPVEVKVPVEHNVILPVPIETPVPYAVEVERPVTVEKIVQKEVRVPYPVEKKVPYAVHYETKVPVPYAVEKRIPVTVEKIVEKPFRVEVPFPQPVPVPVHVPQPYPVDRIVEKKVPYPVPVDRIVEKKVHVKVPYPVEKIVEKIVEKPVVVTKYIDKPYPVEKRIPYPVEKIVEKRVPYPVQVPVEVKVPVYKYDYKTPYQFEKPAYVKQSQELQYSQNSPQYQKYEQQKQNPSQSNPSYQKYEQQIQNPSQSNPSYQKYEQQIQNPSQSNPSYQKYEQQIQNPSQSNLSYLKYEQQKQSPSQSNPSYQKYEHQIQNPPQSNPLYQKYEQQKQNPSQSNLSYQKYSQEQKTMEQQMNQQLNQQLQAYAAQYYQYMKDKQRNEPKSQHWGNLYASSYQHINQTTDRGLKFKKTPTLNGYVSYVTNSKAPYPYYGPPPAQSYESAWENNNDHLLELKLRRTDRMPKVANLRIEYGGFKPPLIPSTEVDLDGIPVKKDEMQT